MTTATRRVLTAIVGLVLVVGLAVAANSLGHRPGQDNAAPDGSSTPDRTSVPAEPSVTPAPSPSASAPAEADGPPPAPNPTIVPLTPTTVTASFWGFDAASATAQVGGYADVVESDGACTLVLTLADHEVSVSGPAQADAATTTCGTLSVPRSQLSAGTWSAELGYTSATSTGVAPTVTIEVP